MRGFKSSGPRTVVVNFERGFTVITGPNGSGKSNLADAIAFTIGENSPKALRAANGRLSGLIYDPRKEDSSGSGKPSACRVTLQFENSDRAIPIDSDLVTLTRELREDGENTYFLNGRKSTRSALTEIIDLAGLAPGGFNIVAQGAATRMADLTPEEKRKVIESVVGISKFDERKAEAQRQLSQADQRLEVAMARIGEMKSTLESLDSQRTEMVRYNLLESQINWLNAVITSKKVADLKARLAGLRSQEQELTGKLGDLGARMVELENRVAQVESDKTKFIVEVIQGGGASHVELQFQLAGLRNELETLEADFKTAEGNVAELEGETVPQLKQVVAEKQRESNAASSAVRQLTAEIEKLDAKHAELAQKLKEFFRAGEELRGTIEKKGKLTAKVQFKLADLAQKQTQVELAINAANASLSVERKRLDELKLRVDGYSEVLGKLEANTKQLFELHDSSTKELGAIDENLSGAETTRERLVASIQGASKILEKASAEMSKEEAFRHLSESLAGERSGQMKLQEFCDQGGVPGYVGRLGQVVKYPQQYSRAVNAVMGKWLGAFVVQDLKSMTQLIKAAKSLKAKSFSVIPLSEVESVKAADVEKSAGVLGPLSAVIKCEEEFEGLVNFLAGDSVLVETEAVGYIMASEGIRAVTEAGETFEPGGRAFSYGYQELVVNLMEGLENIEGMSEVEDAVGALKGAIERRRSELSSIESGTRSMMKERIKKIVTTTSLKAEATTITRMAKRYRSIFKTMNAEYQKQAGAVTRLEERLKASVERKESVAKGISSLQQVVAQAQALGLDAHLADLDATKQSVSAEIDGIRNRIQDLNLTLTREKANLENVLLRALEENQLDLANATEDLQSNKQFAREAPRKIKELSEQKAALEEQISSLKESSKRSQPVLDEFDAKAKRLKEERDSVSRSVAGHQKDLFAIAGQVSASQERIEEALGSLRMLGYAEELEYFESSEPLLADLQQEYQGAAGSVNRGADRQYTEMYLSYKNLSVRHNDLENERNSIISFIESVDSEKKKVFMSAFDRVGGEFGSIFAKLTGGIAQLDLENPDEIFTGGIFMRADFGNGLRESSQHSGGQRAVTGVALILAMQAVQTHPFYLFDEIDAPLDAVNSSSLAKFLKEKSSEAQIIAITLRDVFMAESDITYGVYSAGGTSRVVHYKPAEVPRSA
ncbi:MAG: chromosome segregation protein SMC [Nitrososphaerota archaeon]|jgi:chromosome segregation protein|nr:chromosome segregation protein SMC [Nitrososphaerota archaeon]MDG6957339.1 chromosome segregation protein SMC [Nitrososphaerota archaeon]MDG6959481.1 chromosome segregation protein SMC [Nitrososphaerota archaeon]MDG6969340.1 chromosome segregation protein SMC [Nitrososphaerota archaeon]MDG6973820.1 chromosome segregation protein SMC [Nitrososphaerota archaeon]